MTKHLERAQFLLCALTLTLALTLGGGQGTLGDTAIQLLSLVLLALVFVRAASAANAPPHLPPIAWLALIPLILPLLQLLPLPDVLWTSGPARTDLATDLSTAGITPQPQASLTPLATERALFWLLPAIALFLSTLQLAGKHRKQLLTLFVILAALGAVLGMAQMASGPGGPLRFYSLTNESSAVGFFANRNHHASLLAMALPIVVIGTAWLINREHLDFIARMWRLAAGLMLVALLVLGIAVAGSRGGLLVAMLGVALTVPAILGLRGVVASKRWLAMGLVVSLMLLAQLGLFALMQQRGADPLQNTRVWVAATTLEAAAAHAPLGTGLGGFRAAFETFERKPVDTEWVNHAHNDYLELWLEGGWPAALLALTMAVAFLVAGWHAWRGHLDGGRDAPPWLAQAAWIALLLVLLHSLVDYPLRTSAHLAVFGLLAGLLVRTPQRIRE